MGAKNTCPATPEARLDVSRNNFQNMYQKILEKHPVLKDNPVGVIHAMYNSILKKDGMLADTFHLWVNENFPKFVAQAGVTKAPLPKTTTAERNAALTAKDIVDTFDDTLDNIDNEEE